MNTTTNLGLKMPEYSDQADIQDINDNMELLDGKMGAVGNTSVQEQIDDVVQEIGSTALPTTAQTLTGAIAEHEEDLGTKTDKVSSAMNGHFAGLDASGNLVDSGKQASDFATPVDVEKKADAIEESNSTEAEVMSFSDGADNLPMEISVAINPVQDTHGLDPYPAGAVNQFTLTLTTQEKNGITFTVDQSAGTITANGTASAQVSIAMGTYQSDTAKKYYVKGIPSGASSTTYFITLHSSKQNTFSDGLYDGYKDGTATPYIYIRSGVTVSNLVFKPFFCEEDAYSNICPISGWDSVQITRTNNMLDDTLQTFVKGKYIAHETGEIGSASGYWYTENYISLNPGTYTVRCDKTATQSRGMFAIFYNSNKEYLSGVEIAQAVSSTGNMQGTFTAPSNAVFARFDVPAHTERSLIIQSGNEITITGTTNVFPISLPQTTYGGTLTINKDGSGKLVITSKCITGDAFTWAKNTTYNCFSTTVSDKKPGTGYNSETQLPDGTLVSNKYIVRYETLANITNGTIRGHATNTNLYIRDDSYNSDATAFNNDASNIQIFYELATPVTYSFTAQQIRSLLGENNLWADSSNVLNVVYYADTKMYIDEQKELPVVTSSDNGKVLRVVDGVWSAVSLPSASGVSF